MAHASRHLGGIAVGLVLALGALACSGPETSDRSPVAPSPGVPVVIISIDTVRADRLPIYGYEAGSTPAIDALRGEAGQVADLIRNGARVMVCGGRDMAMGVTDALAEILSPFGLTPAVLKAEGRYVEDVY